MTFNTNSKLASFRLVCVAIGFSGVLFCAAWGQTTPTINTGCAGAVSAPMEQAAAPYRQALAALKGSEVGWCVIAAESNADTPRNTSLWEFTSAAYVFHALRGKKELTPAQQTAMRALLAQIPGVGAPPTRLKQIDTALYVHMRTLAAADYTDTMVLLDSIEQHSPAVYGTLMRRSSRWGDADDN